MKLAATALVIGTLVGSAGLPAFAMEGRAGGGGGPDLMERARGHRHMNGVLRCFPNQASGNTYTMVGMERVRSTENGWYGGYGCYSGLNLAQTAGAGIASHGGFLFGKDFGEGPLTFGVGMLLGMGYDLSASPNLTFSNFGAYFVGEPRLNLGWVMSPYCELALSAGYLATTHMGHASGPTFMLTLSKIRMGMGRMRGMGR